MDLDIWSRGIGNQLLACLVHTDHIDMYTKFEFFSPSLRLQFLPETSSPLSRAPKTSTRETLNLPNSLLRLQMVLTTEQGAHQFPPSCSVTFHLDIECTFQLQPS